MQHLLPHPKAAKPRNNYTPRFVFYRKKRTLFTKKRFFSQPLDSCKSEVRLLQILPSSDEDSVIECRLSKCSLDESPDYFGLSYVWGDASVTKDIRINGHPFRVTSNLALGL